MYRLKIILTVGLIMGASQAAVAGSCPAKIAALKSAVSAGSIENIAEVKKLLELGTKQHASGDHAESVATLKKAMNMAGM